jgi:hypothetical protein
MNKFSKIVEQLENKKYFKAKAEIDISTESDNEGEASYVIDSTLASINGQSGYNIKIIEEISKEEYNELLIESTTISGDEYYGRPISDNEELSDEEKVLKTWEAEFGDRTPTSTEKMEFYHQLRSAGIDGILIHSVLSDKLFGKLPDNLK